VNKRFWPVLTLVAALAVAVRLVLYLLYRPEGLEPDGLGMALLFWHPTLLQDQLPMWWRELMPKIGGYWPPGYALANGLLARVVGDPFVAARVVSAVCAAPLVVFVALTARRLAESDLAGWFAGALMAVAPLSLAWDVRVRPETMFLALYVPAVYFALLYHQNRRRRDLLWATGLAGAAAVVKYEIIVFAPVLAYLWFLHLRARHWRDLPWGVLVGQGWAVALAWMLNNEAARAGDYSQLFTLMMIKQFPLWFALTWLALPVVLTLPVAALAVAGGWEMGRYRLKRPALWLLIYLMFGHVATMAAGYNWTSRYLLILLPWAAVLAGVGLAALPGWRGLRPAVAGLVLALCLVSAVFWVRAERDKWGETVAIGRAVAQLAPAEARVWSDDLYLSPYWAERNLLPLDRLESLQPGDYVLLSDFFGALHFKRRVDDSLKLLRERFDARVIADKTVIYRPLSGEVIDPAELATKPDLRALGPRTFWSRKTPVQARAVLVMLSE